MSEIDLDNMDLESLKSLLCTVQRKVESLHEKVQVNVDKYLTNLPEGWVEGYRSGSDGFMLCYSFDPFLICLWFWVVDGELKVTRALLSAVDSDFEVELSSLKDLHERLRDVSDLNLKIVTSCAREEAKFFLLNLANELI